MTDNLTHLRPRNPHHIDLDQGDDVRYWTRQFRCSVEELDTAVRRVGHSPAAIKRALKKRASRRVARFFQG